MPGPRALATLAAIVLASCGPAATPDAAIELVDTAITLDRSDVPAGHLVLSIHNRGTAVHELQVIRTDLAAAALPQDGAHIKVRGKIAEKENIKAGATKQLTIDLTPGRYVLVCDLPGHYAAGMRTALIVR